MNVRTCLAGVGLIAVVGSAAAGHTLEYRIVERVGNVDHVLPGNEIIVRQGSAHRYRIQFKAVPDDENDVLAGFISWTTGQITTTGGINTRTAAAPNPTPRGRVYPFLLAPPTGDGQPLTDPFTSLTGIDAAIAQAIFDLPWNCSPEGEPLPRPTPRAFGRNEFVSTFEITSVATASNYTITASGNLNVADAWNDNFCRTPPDCGDPGDPSDDVPTSCLRPPLIQFAGTFSYTLSVRVCTAEWNDDRQVDSRDFFDFIADFFEGNADLNNDGQTTSADFFVYVAAFLNGC